MLERVSKEGCDQIMIVGLKDRELFMGWHVGTFDLAKSLFVQLADAVKDEFESLANAGETIH